MRYKLTDYEWAAIKSFLPSKLRGVPDQTQSRKTESFGIKFSSDSCAAAGSEPEIRNAPMALLCA